MATDRNGNPLPEQPTLAPSPIIQGQPGSSEIPAGVSETVPLSPTVTSGTTAGEISAPAQEAIANYAQASDAVNQARDLGTARAQAEDQAEYEGARARIDAEKDYQRQLAEEQKRYAEVQKSIADRVAEKSRAYDEAVKAGGRSLWEEKSTGQKILAAIAGALSQGSTIMAGGSGPSPVQQKFAHEQEMDLARKKEKIAGALELMQREGASAAQLRQAHLDMLASLEAVRAAQVRQVDEMGKALVSLHPKYGPAWQQESAKLNQASAETLMNKIAELTHKTVNSSRTTPGGTRTTQTPLAQAGGGKDVGVTIGAREGKRDLERSKEIAKTSDYTPEAAHELELGEKKAANVEHMEESGVGRAVVGAGRAILPEELGNTLLPKGPAAGIAPEQAEQYQLLRKMVKQQVALQFGARMAGNPAAFEEQVRLRMPNPTDTEEMAKRKIDAIWKSQEDLVDLGEGTKSDKKIEATRAKREGGAPSPTTPRPAAPPASSSALPRTTAELAAKVAALPPDVRDNIAKARRIITGKAPGNKKAAREYMDLFGVR